MKLIDLDSIRIDPNRQRENVPDDHIGELLESIHSSVGLINPIVVEGTTLIAGECRLRAIRLGHTLGKQLTHAGQAIPRGKIPVTEFSELTELQRKEIEYAENAYRKDLDWQENVKALASLHELRTLQAAETGKPAPLLKDTAQEVFKRSDGAYTSKVSDSLLLAKNLANPEVAKASSVKEAKKILARQDDIVRRTQLAAMVGTSAHSDRFKVYNADCLAWAASQPEGQFDVILTDPPYGMGADSFGDAAGRMAGLDHLYKDDEASVKPLLERVIPETYRLAKPEAHLYLWCDLDLFHWLREQCQAAGWWVFRTPLVNIKPEGGRVPWPEHGPRRSYELCLFAVKGKRKVNSIRPDVFESRLVEGNFGHGAQKPVEAYVELLKRSTRPGDVVLDLFAGSGTIFAAAAEAQCSAVGIELAPHAYGICLERIGALK